MRSLGQPLTLPQAGAARLRVDLSVDEAHDRIEVLLWTDSILADVSPGTTLSIGIGDHSGTEDVLTGQVWSVDVGPSGLRVTAFAPSRALSSTFVGRSYVDQSVADVVSDLLSECDVDGGDIDAPLRMPVVHIDPARSVWAALHNLAQRTGRQVTSAPDGAVEFGPIPGGSGGAGLLDAVGSVLAAGEDLREGAELVRWSVCRRPVVDPPGVVTPSAGTGPRWHVLAAEPDDASSTVRVAAGLRTREAADAYADARSASAARRGHLGRVRVPGRPGLRAGQVVSIRGEQYRLLRVAHTLDGTAGYLSDLMVEGM